MVGLGYVGMPIAVAFAKKGIDVIGFDLNEAKIELYKNGIDPTKEVGDEAIQTTTVQFTSDEKDLQKAKFHIVAVPTPVNDDHTPDLSPVEGASRILGRNLTKGSVVVFESTVYPGVTEDVCVPILEAESGLKCGVDFKIGYSPERINPGDKVHRLETIVKIVSGMDAETLDKRIIRDFEKHNLKEVGNSLSDLLPSKLIPVILNRWGIDKTTRCNVVTKEQRKALVELLKNLEFEITGTRPIDEAIITRGGIKVSEINPKTMESKICSGLYFCGEVLDVDAYTGGFNLQIAFSLVLLNTTLAVLSNITCTPLDKTIPRLESVVKLSKNVSPTTAIGLKKYPISSSNIESLIGNISTP